jgi:plastocyanin
MQRRFVIVIAVTALVAAGACSKKAEPTAAAPVLAEVRAGLNDTADKAIAILEFLPAAVTVKSGASVQWTVTGPEPHNITFLPTGQKAPSPESKEAAALRAPKPATGPIDGTQTVSSGLGPRGPEPLKFTAAFSMVGTYSYFCVIHPLMTGTVTVVADATKADSQVAITARGVKEEAGWLTDGRAAKKRLTETPAKSVKNSDGTTTWTILMGTTTEHADVLAFQPATPEAKAGDKIVFLNDSAAPHTATFPGSKPAPQNPEAPEVMKASGKSPLTLNATAYLNTGWLPPNVPPGAGPPEAARTFTFLAKTAGTYSYICALHVPSGMAGAVKVA